jgi:creatinine amidohydrolase
MNRKYMLDEMTWQEAEKAFKSGAVVILTIGTVEQHGLHLPLGSDSIIPFELAKRLGEKANVIVLPPWPYGFAPHALPWPGSISVKHETVAAMLKDILNSVILHGASKIILLSGHPEHEGIMESVGRETMRDWPNVELMVLGYWSPPILDVIRETAEHLGFHAHEAETSIILALRPDLVKMERAVKEEPRDRWSGDPPSNYRELLLKPLESKAPFSGTSGDPSGASKEKGEKMVQVWVERMTKFIEDWIKEDKV